jgi:protein involved in polysaccharide export with SLBB domain
MAMKNKKINKKHITMTRIITIIFLCMATMASFAQDIPQNIDPNQMSDAEVQQAKKKLEQSGLSRDAAVELARQRGASEQQIQDMLRRMDEGSTVTSDDIAADALEPDTDDEQSTADDDASEVQEEEITDLTQRSGGYTSASNRFGTYLFDSSNSSFEPNPNIPTPRDYIINIGDEIVITIWGNSQASYQLTVNKNGQIIIPDIGPVVLAGITFDEAQDKLSNKLSSIYADIKGPNPGTFAQIDLGKMRSIKVHIIGDARRPGTYTLPATASVFNALYLSGGPNNIGSFRNINLLRDNKPFATVDVYKYLVEGKLNENHILQDEDVIFIPTLNKQVKVSGSFKRNALFELTNGETIHNLINFAGGYTDETYKHRMKLYRKSQDGLRIQDFTQNEIDDIKLQNGDMLTAEKILQMYENRVTINGSVFRPGEYEWTYGLTLSQLIKKADSITADSYKKQGHIIRLNDDMSNRFVPFNLAEVLNGETDYYLQPEDLITIKSHFQLKEPKFFSVTGNVIKPGTFNYIDSVRITDAIYLANGLKDGTYDIAHIVRTNPDDKTLRYIKFSLDDVMNGTGNIYLKNRDILTIKAAPQMKEQQSISVTGQVNNPNTFSFKENMTLTDAIYLANGFTEGADTSYIEVSRRLGYKKESNRNDTLRYIFQFKLPRDLTDTTEAGSFALQPDDRISVHRNPGYVKPGAARIQGEVLLSGSYALNTRDMRISDLIEKAGGLTSDAYVGGAQFQRLVNGQMELVGLDLQKIINNPDKSDQNLLLQDGDMLIIPRKMDVVNITGNVLDPMALTYEKGKGLRHYIDQAGGFDERTRKNKIYVKYANGTTEVTKLTPFRNYPPIEPGCQIIVPRKPEKSQTDNTGKWLSIASTLSSLTVAVSAILNNTGTGGN